MEVAGIDIWKGAWVVVTLVDGAFSNSFTTPTIRDACARLTDSEVVGIDIPIGLPDVDSGRPADHEARALVGPRRSSVFLTPCRELLTAPSHKAACALAEARGWKGISAQAFGLRSAILEVDAVAATDDRIHEIHPEVTLRVMAGGVLTASKRTWNGMHDRRRLLADGGIELPDDLGPAGLAGFDDVLDAAACTWSAHRIATGAAKRLPAGVGRLSAIWA
jgi:predicted RNase H-like nuclease